MLTRESTSLTLTPPPLPSFDSTNWANNRTIGRFDVRLATNLTLLGRSLAVVTDAQRSGHVDRRDLLELHRNVGSLYSSL